MTHSTEEIASALEDYTGDIWVFQEENQLNETVKELEGVTQLEVIPIEMEYYDYSYTMVHYVKE